MRVSKTQEGTCHIRRARAKTGKKKNNTRMWKKIQKIQKTKKKQTSPECVELEVIPKR